MSETEFLNVWFHSTLVGKLWKNIHGAIGFQYELDWVKKGFAISQQLPLTTEAYSPEMGKAHQFFANLLPEGDARIHIVKNMKISNSDFALLKAKGGECAGALSILPTEEKPSQTIIYNKLSKDELKQIILNKGQFQVLQDFKNPPRLSLAGAQDKCPVYYDGKDFYLPNSFEPTTHILKFELLAYRNIPLYEYCTAQLAQLIHLPVVDIQLCQMDKIHYLLIKRFDRLYKADGKILRLHQEDFCQALNFGYEKKYQQEGGPTFYECYRLLKQVSSFPLFDLENLLKWQIFNVLSGNSDGHAKNLALIYDQDHTVRLAPFYDLVCTRAIKQIDTRLAMSVGDEFDPDFIHLQHWNQLAEQCNIRKPYLFQLIYNVANTLVNQITKKDSLFSQLLEQYPALQRVKLIISKQTRKILREITIR